MKTKITLLFLLLSVTAMAQFPAPENFVLTVNYIEQDQTGYCNGEPIVGPDYCINYNWVAPNLTTTTATLDHYNVYCHGSESGITQFLFSTSETSVENGLAGIGDFWVTAVYTNPEGESEPSNIQGCELPISINEQMINKEISIFYNPKTETLNITSNESISKLNVFDSQGKIIKLITNLHSIANLAILPSGLYIVEATTQTGKVYRQKIVK